MCIDCVRTDAPRRERPLVWAVTYCKSWFGFANRGNAGLEDGIRIQKERLSLTCKEVVTTIKLRNKRSLLLYTGGAKMKTIKLFLVLIFFLCPSFILAQNFETIQFGDGTQKFSHPVWSPNGENLAFWGPGGIYVCKWDGSEQPRKIFDTYGEDLMWASDSELVYWQRKSWEEKQEGQKPKRMEKESVRTVTLSGKEKVVKEGNNLSVLLHAYDGTIYFYEGDAIFGTPFIVGPGKSGVTDPSEILKVVSHYPPLWDSRIKGRPIFEDTDLWIQNLNGSHKERITYGKEYSSPRLSPDGQNILVNDFIVLNRDGKELTNLNPGTKMISKAVSSIPCCSEWSPDSKKIVYIMETDNDGTQMIEGSDLYIINIDGTGRTQITNTPNEIDPEWSPDGTKIACWSENTNKIFVVKLK
jgi:Tol biopolymer transport system component